MEEKKVENITFVCPNCGEVHRDDVLFLCNKCDQVELVFKDGIYLCPSCLEPGENFECLTCDSKEVTMEVSKKTAGKEDIKDTDVMDDDFEDEEY